MILLGKVEQSGGDPSSLTSGECRDTLRIRDPEVCKSGRFGSYEHEDAGKCLKRFSS
jgi:hypothetical protein